MLHQWLWKLQESHNDQQQAMGHWGNCNTRYRHYFQLQSAVDIQGLVIHGVQDSSLPLLQSLPCKDKAKEIAALEASKEVAQLIKEHNELQAQLLAKYKTAQQACNSNSELHCQANIAMARLSYKSNEKEGTFATSRNSQSGHCLCLCQYPYQLGNKSMNCTVVHSSTASMSSTNT